MKRFKPSAKWWALGVLVVGGLASVPVVLKSQLQSRLSDALGRTVTVGSATVNPFTLSVGLRELVIADANPSAPPLLTVDAARVNLSVSSLFRWAPVIEALSIERPRIHLTRRADASSSIDDLIARLKPSTPTPPTDTGPAKFALHNLKLSGGELRLNDESMGQEHVLDQVELGLPFVSTIPSQVDTTVEPHLAFRLNGDAFDTGAQATPFADSRQGQLKLKVDALDLEPYLRYVPAQLPLRPSKGVLHLDVDLKFAMPDQGSPAVSLHGMVGASSVDLKDASDARVLAWSRVQAELKDVQPLKGSVHLSALSIDGLRAEVQRDASGEVSLWRSPPPAATPKASEPKAPEPKPAESKSDKAEASPAWRVQLDQLSVRDSALEWRDASVRPAAHLQLTALDINAQKLAWPWQAATPLQASAQLSVPGESEAAKLKLKGELQLDRAELDIDLAQFRLAPWAPYFHSMLTPRLDGKLSAEGQLRWATGKQPPAMSLLLKQARLDSLTVTEAGPSPSRSRASTPAVSWQGLAISDTLVDLTQRQVTVGELQLTQPSVSLERRRDTGWNVQQWLRSDGAETQAAADRSPPAKASAPSPAWRVRLNQVGIAGGQVRLLDEAAASADARARSVQAELSQLQFQLKGFDWHGDAKTPPAQLQLKAQLRDTSRARGAQRPAGRIDLQGQFALNPWTATGRARIEQFPLHSFASYVADTVPMRVRQAELGYNGQWAAHERPQGTEASLQGQLMLGQVRVDAINGNSATASTPSLVREDGTLFSWDRFALRDMKLQLKPSEKPRLDVGSASLDRFYARVVLTEDGRFNFQAPDGSAVPVGTDTATPPAPAPGGASQAGISPAQAASAPANANAPPTNDSPDAAADLPILLNIGATQLTQGSIDFNDRLIKPNYRAELTELQGRIGRFSAESREMADVSLRGRVAGTGLLDLSGQINPAVRPVALNIQAQAKEVELAPLSPYAGKYAGYGIDHGKLSLEVAYRIDADGSLNASNRLVLNQLTFGDKVDSPEATSLPVRLAVSLLKDRNGVIDLNLPISGSLNDPQFSIGGIVVKLIGNLLTKALTAPFSLLAGGGDTDLSAIGFVPGTAELNSGATAALDKVAQALGNRPALKLTITPSVDPASELIAYQDAAIEAKLWADHRRQNPQATGPSASAPDGDKAPQPPVMSSSDRSKLLKALYDRSKLPNKPRMAIGLAKRLPDDEMAALLRQLVPVTDAQWQALAVARGNAVRDALLAKGLASERLFLGSPKLGKDTQAEANAQPGVKLGLAEH